MAGADEADADLIAKAIEARPWPTYEERLAVFEVVGPWRPSREPFSKGMDDGPAAMASDGRIR